MTHGSLFSGIGGFDLAAEWMGWSNIFHCEWNEFSSKVLKYYWPDATSYTDITKTDFTIHRGEIDILTGGFPCPSFSQAGQRKGTEDDRYLWPEMLRAVQEIQPTYVVAENVPGLVNWGSGVVFERIQADLENEGYQVSPYLLPACSVQAPHKRDRIFFIAYSESKRRETRIGKEIDNGGRPTSEHKPKGREIRTGFEPVSGRGASSHPSSIRQPGQGRAGQSVNSKAKGNWKASWSNDVGTWPTQSPVCNGNDGLSSRLDGITFSKWRKESIMAGGNAIVPQIAYEIFFALEQSIPTIP